MVSLTEESVSRKRCFPFEQGDSIDDDENISVNTTKSLYSIVRTWLQKNDGIKFQHCVLSSNSITTDMNIQMPEAESLTSETITQLIERLKTETRQFEIEQQKTAEICDIDTLRTINLKHWKKIRDEWKFYYTNDYKRWQKTTDYLKQMMEIEQFEKY